MIEKIKTELLTMIESAEDPFDIIMTIAKDLEEISNEPKYAENVSKNLRTVYGFVFKDKKLLKDELTEVEKRLQVIEERSKLPDFTEEERTRINFAADRHKKNIERLKRLIAESEQ